MRWYPSTKRPDKTEKISKFLSVADHLSSTIINFTKFKRQKSEGRSLKKISFLKDTEK
jgi:hypothetical protein